MKTSPAVVGIADHSGWAIFVCVAIDDGMPKLVERRRVELIEAGVPTQPYHHETLALDESEAEMLVARVKQSIATCAHRALERMRIDVRPGRELQAIAIREALWEAPYARLPESVAEVHGSRLLYRADGMLYRIALCEAAEALGLEVHRLRRGDELRRAAEALGESVDVVDRLTNELGRAVGAPWTKEHRSASAAGIAVLARLAARSAAGAVSDSTAAARPCAPAAGADRRHSS